MASLEAQEPLVWNHHGDGSGSIGHLINPISHGGGHDAEMRQRVSSFSLQVTTRVGGVYPPSPHPPLLRNPLPQTPPPAVSHKSATVLLAWASCGGNVVLWELVSASHHDDSFPESSTAIAPLWHLCAPFVRCVVLKGNSSNSPFFFFAPQVY